jgi:hypothetical protein
MGPRISLLVVAVTLLVAFQPCPSADAVGGEGSPPGQNAAPASKGFGEPNGYGMGPCFTENKGQLDNRAAFLYSNSNPSVQFLAGAVLLRYLDAPALPEISSSDFIPREPAIERYHVLRMSFPGSSLVIPVGQERLSYDTNCFFGREAAGWVTGAPNYRSVVYSGIYDNIDLKIYWSGNGLKYDFIVAPGGEPRAIRVRYEGADVSLAGNSVQIETSLGTITDGELVAYQDIAGERCPVDAGLALSAGVVSYRLGSYDRAQALIIDPLLYSTFVGGGGDETVTGIAVDWTGAAIVTGYTISQNFPTTPGAYDTKGKTGGAKPYYDAFVFKLTPNGDSLAYSTYLGSGKDDYSHGIAVDASGNACIAGTTNEFDFPVTQNAFDGSYAGYTDGFVLALAPGGNRIIYSTFLGGEYVDRAYGIALDENGSAYVTGTTTSFDFPTTENAYHTHLTVGTDYQDAFLVKLVPNGTALSYSTYVGGGYTEYGLAVAVSANGSAVITGTTRSTDFPVTSGAFMRYWQGDADAFVARLDNAGKALVYSTYIGSPLEDAGLAIALDADMSAYITGYTRSALFPISSGSFDYMFGGYQEAFVCKLSANCTMLYSSYLGGDGSDSGTGITVDGMDNALVVGSTESDSFPVTTAGWLKGKPGQQDGFLAIVNANGIYQLYGTYIGGSESDSCAGVVIAPSGYILMAGTTHSADFPTSQGSYNWSCNGSSQQAFVLELFPTLTPPRPQLYARGGDRRTGLRWDPPSENSGSITDYYIYRGWNESDLRLLRAVPAGANTYEDTGLKNGDVMYYALSAINGSGEGQRTWSQKVTVGVPPDVPWNLRAIPGNNQVVLYWSTPNNTYDLPILKYRLYRGSAWTDPQMLVELVGKMTYTDTEAFNGLNFKYYVTAVNMIGESLMSDYAYAFPSAFPSKPQYFVARLDERDVSLSWEAPLNPGSSEISNYTIYKTEEGDREKELALTQFRTYQDRDLPAGTYYYRVAAINARGGGEYSDAVKVEVLNTPPTVRFTYSPARGTSATEFRFMGYAEDSDGRILNYTWHFGDGALSYKQDVSHTYVRRGWYDVVLHVRDNDNEEAVFCATVTVDNIAPSIASHSPATELHLTVGVSREFSFAGSDPDNDALAGAWYINEVPASSGYRMNVTFSKIGTTRIRGVVTDGLDFANATWTVVVEEKPFVAPVTMPYIIGAASALIIVAAGILVWRRMKNRPPKVAPPEEKPKPKFQDEDLYEEE